MVEPSPLFRRSQSIGRQRHPNPPHALTVDLRRSHNRVQEASDARFDLVAASNWQLLIVLGSLASGMMWLFVFGVLVFVAGYAKRRELSRPKR